MQRFEVTLCFLQGLGSIEDRLTLLPCQHGGCLRAHLPAAVGSSMPNTRKSKEEFDTTEGTQQVGTIRRVGMDTSWIAWVGRRINVRAMHIMCLHGQVFVKDAHDR